jgi:hypothetical protein
MYPSAMERIVRIGPLWARFSRLIEDTRKFLASCPATSGGSVIGNGSRGMGRAHWVGADDRAYIDEPSRLDGPQ